jgi:hypothetical protein
MAVDLTGGLDIEREYFLTEPQASRCACRLLNACSKPSSELLRV